MDTRLLNFLKDDVTALIKAIRNNDTLAAMETTSANFETLEDFANYWEIHIKNI